MIRYLPFLALLFFSFIVSAEEDRAALERLILKSVAAGKIQSIMIVGRNPMNEVDRNDIRVFEPPGVCGDFDLTAADVRDFFKKAQIFLGGVGPIAEKSERDRAIIRNGASRCSFWGKMILQGGRDIEWSINRSRGGSLAYSTKKSLGFHDTATYVYCDTCENKMFYPPATLDRPAPFRPVLQSAVIEKDGFSADDLEPDFVDAPDRCKHFKMSENDVLNFFKMARTISEREEYGYYYRGFCLAEGKGVLQDGRKVDWRIDNAARGRIVFSENDSKDKNFIFHCAECSEEKYVEVCTDDSDCFGL